MLGIGAELRDARAKAGLSLEEAARRTKIPARYLDALEKGDTSVFPAGPFLSGYTKQYRSFLGLGEPVAPPPSARPAAPEKTETTSTTGAIFRASRWRKGAFGLGVFAALVLVWRVGAEAMKRGDGGVGEAPDQTVLVNVVEPVRATVVADGRIVHEGVLQPGPQRRFEAHDRLEVDLASLGSVTIVYNGRTLKPLGAQSRPRRLVFVDDAAE
ncbi:MAG: RodZ domain-containing protein [Myxococcota bacterium]